MDRAEEARNILDNYFLYRTAYAKALRNGKLTAKEEEDYLKVEREILELMGVD